MDLELRQHAGRRNAELLAPQSEGSLSAGACLHNTQSNNQCAYEPDTHLM